jgi:hypothetical protein
MTRAGSLTTPRRYAPYERRVETYCQSQGYRVTLTGYEHTHSWAEQQALKGRYDREAMAIRTMPDMLVTAWDGTRVSVEAKAKREGRENASVEAVALFFNVLRSTAPDGWPVNYVFSPADGAMIARNAVQICAVRREIRYTPNWLANAVCQELATELGLNWSWREGRPKDDGDSDPYIVIPGYELREWSVLADSETIDAINETRRHRG